MAARAMATKVLCNKGGGGEGSQSNGDKGGGQATVMETMWAMATAIRLAVEEEGKCKAGKGNGNVNEGGR